MFYTYKKYRASYIMFAAHIKKINAFFGLLKVINQSTQHLYLKLKQTQNALTHLYNLRN